MKSFKERERGATTLEFALCAIPLIFAVISVAQMSFAMWNYHTLAETVKLAARVAAVRGVDCAGQGCAMTIGQYSTFITNHGIGLPASSLNITFTSAAGSISCAPISSCSSNATTWPPTGGNAVNQLITVTGTVSVSTGIAMFVPGKGGGLFAPATFGAVSQQLVSF